MNKIKNTTLMLLTAGVFLSMFSVGFSQKSYAASQDECAIWLCLPGGFPQGCGAAYGAMIDRIKSRKPPLPNFSSCATQGSGKYVMGYERFEPCDDTYELELSSGYENNQQQGKCVKIEPRCKAWLRGTGVYYANLNCTPYDAIRRPKPYFVEMWANGEYIGKFFYQ